ncbi:MAG: putative SOS response-associated peptidase YedK [Salibacteraceae bacterium]|jgi:putative SOS response-associated peptidase YedK
MCFHSQQQKSPQEIAKRFNLDIDNVPKNVTGVYNGFDFPKTPIISNDELTKVQLFDWGLIPSWSTNNEIRKFTLNAKIETLAEKPSFKNLINNRCLIISSGFFEWQWRDSKGKEKRKYLIKPPQEEIFAFAGIWSEWTNPKTGELQKTYSIITTEANELMSKIHNTKKRMPLVLPREKEFDWLNTIPVSEVMKFDGDLEATEITSAPRLF